jgi:hypothetical protein
MAKRNIWDVAVRQRVRLGRDHSGSESPPLVGDRPNEQTISKAEYERRRAKVAPVDRDARMLADGSPVPEDGSHTQVRPGGQHKAYVVLSDEERAKGFQRRVRDSYVHIGPPQPVGLRDLTPEEQLRYGEYGYLKFEPNPDYPATSSITGTFWTQDRLDRLNKGCGTKTTMGRKIAETYAREPTFYGSTFCCGCGTHFPVGERGEFVWDGTNERVGT